MYSVAVSTSASYSPRAMVDQHVDLILGLVLPHPADHRAVGQPEAGVLRDPVEDPFEGEDLGPGAEALLTQDGATLVQQQPAELFAGLPRFATRRRPPGFSRPHP